MSLVVPNRIRRNCRCSWLKEQQVTGVLSVEILLLKRKFYKVAVRPEIMYRSEC